MKWRLFVFIVIAALSGIGWSAPRPTQQPGIDTSFPPSGGETPYYQTSMRRAPVLLPDVEPKETGAHIVINLPAFRLFLYIDGHLQRHYPIAIGSEVSPSRLGETKIINKVINPTYYPPNWAKKGLKPIPPGPENPVGTRWMGLGFEHYGIHGTNAPNSIGKAVSNGCIRLHEHHVRELFELVSIGTPVTLVYQTLFAMRDLYTQEPLVVAYRDIYNKGTNTVEILRSTLRSRLGLDLSSEEWYVPAIASMAVASRQRPAILPLPRSTSVFVHGRQEPLTGFSFGDQRYIPLEPLRSLPGVSSDHFRQVKSQLSGRRAPSGLPRVLPVEGQWYVNLDALVSRLGLRLAWTRSDSEGGAPVIYGLHVYVDDHPVNVPARWHNGEAHLSVRALANIFGSTVTINGSGLPCWDGVPLRHTVEAHGELFVRWDELTAVAGVRGHRTNEAVILQRARLVVNGQATAAWRPLLREGTIYVPLVPLSEPAGWRTVAWDGERGEVVIDLRRRYKATVTGGRVYMKLEDLVEITPHLIYVWDREQLELSVLPGQIAKAEQTQKKERPAPLW